jgi:hypothetical protein
VRARRVLAAPGTGPSLPETSGCARLPPRRTWSSVPRSAARRPYRRDAAATGDEGRRVCVERGALVACRDTVSPSRWRGRWWVPEGVQCHGPFRLSADQVGGQRCPETRPVAGRLGTACLPKPTAVVFGAAARGSARCTERSSVPWPRPTSVPISWWAPPSALNGAIAAATRARRGPPRTAAERHARADLPGGVTTASRHFVVRLDDPRRLPAVASR